MTEATLADKTPATASRAGLVAWLAPALTLAVFAVVFAKPAALLARDWWNDPEAGHGLLLFPAAVWLVWKRGLRPDRAGQPILGLLLLAGAVLLRIASDLASAAVHHAPGAGGRGRSAGGLLLRLPAAALLVAAGDPPGAGDPAA